MSTMDEILAAVGKFGTDQLMIAHSTSAYPCPPQELNLRMIETLGDFSRKRRSVIPVMKPGWLRQWLRWLWAPVSWKDILRWTGPCGVPIMRPASSRRVCRSW
jgi:hypothetical protein